MAFSFLTAAFVFLLLNTLVLALQVTPNSPCSGVCVGGGSKSSDPTSSDTHGGDIVCNDADYAFGKGQQFQQCLDCLQTSSFGTDAENDQMWFIYNLRYASDWCFFGANNTERLSGPCMVHSTCNTLSKSLSAGNDTLDAGAIFDYCTADNPDFSVAEPTCYSCLQHMDRNIYLSNFLTALQAGCSQHPTQSSLIGLDGSVFSLFPVNITATSSSGTSETPVTSSSKGLSTGAKVGIAVSCILFAIIVTSAVLICLSKRRRARNKLDALRTQYDVRHGSFGISPPTNGAYSNYKPEPVSEASWGAQNIAVDGVNRSISPPPSAYTKFSSISSGRSSLVSSPEPLTLAAAPVAMRAITPTPTPAPAPQPAGPPNPLRMNSIVAPGARSSAHSQPSQAPYNASASTSTYMHFNRPGRASSIMSSSTTFSPQSAATSPPAYPTALYNHRQLAPLPTYNPRDYAPTPPRLAPPPAQPLPQPPVTAVPLQKQTVPIISLPIPAPRRDTIDMRSFVGLGISTAGTSTPVPNSVPISAVQADPPVPLSRSSSLRELAGRLLPRAGNGSTEGDNRGDAAVASANGRRRSGSKPRRERSESRTRLQGGREGRERRPFEFIGQDTVRRREESSPQSAAESVEQWPGQM